MYLSPQALPTCKNKHYIISKYIIRSRRLVPKPGKPVSQVTRSPPPGRRTDSEEKDYLVLLAISQQDMYTYIFSK